MQTTTTAASDTRTVAPSMEEVLKAVTWEYLDTLDKKRLPPLKEVASGVIAAVSDAFKQHNADKTLDRQEKWPIPLVLNPAQIADIICACFHVVNVSLTEESEDEEYDLPAIYQESGPLAGTYSVSEKVFRRLAKKLHYTASDRDMKEVMKALGTTAPHVAVRREQDEVAVNNGIFDFRTKKLMPFTPEKVFLGKCPVDYVPFAKNPVIHNPDDNTDWDVESWMGSLSGDPAVVNVLWQTIGAVIRPNVRWDRIVIMYSKKGNNGKGTLCRLMENLCGKKNCASLQMADFSKEFVLEPLIGASAIIVDENDVGTYIDKAAALKAVVTGDTIQINRKFKQPVFFQFRGLMVQCVNELPKTRDKTDSMYRRQLLIPFTKCFTGEERKYIKHDYLGRKEVLEYVLWRVLNMDYYELDEPAACKALKAECMEDNNPVLQFWNEFREQFVWDDLPFGFLYDLYKAWHIRFNQGGTLFGKRMFIRELRRVIESDPEWEATDNAPINRGKKLYMPEYLVDDYKLIGWKWYDNGIDKYGPPVTMKNYKGLYRVTPAGGTGTGGQNAGGGQP